MYSRHGSRRAWASSRRWTVELALEALAALDRSGRSLRDFAEREGIAVERLARWRRQLRGHANRAPAFVELKPGTITDGQGDPDAFEVVLSSGRIVRVPSDFDASALQRLLVVLEDQPC